MSDNTTQTPASVIATLVAAWSQNPSVEAILLFGSHAHGVATDQSDIDLYVLASDPADVPGDGLYRKQGQLVEAFINTRAFFEKHFERFHADNSRIGQSQFAASKILFDRHGEGSAIQQTARQWLGKPRVTQTIDQAYWPKRILWSRFHCLEQQVRANDPAIAFVIHGFLYDVYSKYAAFLGHPVMSTDRLADYLSDLGKRKRYLQEEFPDKQFAAMLLEAVRATSESAMFDRATRLKDRAIHAMGGFEIEERSG